MTAFSFAYSEAFGQDFVTNSIQTLSENLRSYLLGSPSVTDYVGLRIYPNWIPQTESTRPNITIDHYGSDHDYTLTEASGWCSARVQIDIWANTLLEAKRVAEGIRSVLQAYDGTLCEVALLRRQFDLFERPEHGDDEPIYHVAQQWEIFIAESVPSFGG